MQPPRGAIVTDPPLVSCSVTSAVEFCLTGSNLESLFSQNEHKETGSMTILHFREHWREKMLKETWELLNIAHTTGLTVCLTHDQTGTNLTT